MPCSISVAGKVSFWSQRKKRNHKRVLETRLANRRVLISARRWIFPTLLLSQRSSCWLNSWGSTNTGREDEVSPQKLSNIDMLTEVQMSDDDYGLTWMKNASRYLMPSFGIYLHRSRGGPPRSDYLPFSKSHVSSCNNNKMTTSTKVKCIHALNPSK